MLMSYFHYIKELTQKIPIELVNFDEDRVPARIPTQASSNFITNKEQGDWAENLIIRAFNDRTKNYVCVKYGKSDDIVAREDGFDKFFLEFQEELDTIGKRPDLLIFKSSDFNQNLGFDISKIPHNEISEYVKMAIAAIEVRSSAFLIGKYNKAMENRTAKFTKIALETKERILTEFSEELQHPSRSTYIDMLNHINEENLSITSFRVPSWSSSKRLIELKDNFKILKNAIKEIQKRDFLSITPKVEDVKVVYKWIETFNVPHYYFQVFFDKIYAISFAQILTIIADSDNEGLLFSIEKDTKNQNKTTIKINSNYANEIAYKIDEPTHKSVRKEMGRGRLLFYVTFEGGVAYLDVDELCDVLAINIGGF